MWRRAPLHCKDGNRQGYFGRWAKPRRWWWLEDVWRPSPCYAPPPPAAVTQAQQYVVLTTVHWWFRLGRAPWNVYTGVGRVPIGSVHRRAAGGGEDWWCHGRVVWVAGLFSHLFLGCLLLRNRERSRGGGWATRSATSGPACCALVQGQHMQSTWWERQPQAGQEAT